MEGENIVEGNRAKASREQEESIKKMASTFEASREGVPEHVVVMVIAYDTVKGQIQLQGPIANKYMSYAMLELAKDAVRTYNTERISGVMAP